MKGRAPNHEVNWTAEMLRISVPSALRAPAASYSDPNHKRKIGYCDSGEAI